MHRPPKQVCGQHRGPSCRTLSSTATCVRACVDRLLCFSQHLEAYRPYLKSSIRDGGMDRTDTRPQFAEAGKTPKFRLHSRILKSRPILAYHELLIELAISLASMDLPRQQTTINRTDETSRHTRTDRSDGENRSVSSPSFMNT